MNAWLAALDRLTLAGAPSVLVTVAGEKGSVPRPAGTKMLVSQDAIAGTIGGGHLELKAIEIARDMLSANAGLDLRRFPLGASLGQCCGGAVTLLFEPIGARPEWLDALLCAERGRVPYVIATAERGGGKAIVTAEAVSGDASEVVVASARKQLDAQGACLETLDDGRWLFERSPDAGLRVVLFGAGHVGRALVHVLGTLPVSVTWADARHDEFPPSLPANVRVEITDTPSAEVTAASPETCFLVMTHSHALDFELADAILRRGDFRWFGLIGSRTKRRGFEQRLAQRGIDAATLARMTCPIGVPGIAGKEPEVIAVAVAAQLLALREDASVAAEPAAHRSRR